MSVLFASDSHSIAFGLPKVASAILVHPDSDLGMRLRNRSWEDRLVEAIEWRSIRNRVRRFRDSWIERLSLAADAVRGRQEFDD